MPEFEPVRVGRGLLGPLRTAGRWSRMAAVLLAAVLTGAAPWGPRGEPGGDRTAPAARSASGRAPAPAPPVPSSAHRDDGAVTVDAPVRIPDAAAVRLLRPGDRVDVLATPAGDASAAAPTGSARIIARNVRVAAVPGAGPEPGTGTGTAFGEEAGALVVLTVPRPTAARLAGAAAHSRLAVTLC
ncbi:RcpC/CpaB family pilus assembly protein [Streptomyces sp. DH37]|uniref:RcpC/CpaB family pilus assembly protein n=1 Tax=Streptomyces sp. DH37 TaxID=3040122 RepID=UPI00301462BA